MPTPIIKLATRRIDMTNEVRPGGTFTTWNVLYALTCLGVFVVFAIFSDADRGIVAGFSSASLILATKTRWDLRNRPWFWVLLTVLGGIHAIAVWLWDGRSVSSRRYFWRHWSFWIS